MRGRVSTILACVAAAASVAALAGCLPPSPAQRARQEASERRFVHDSLIIDSLSRLVPTDSLYRLYRLALKPPGVTNRLITAVACERTRLRFVYRRLPSQWAIHRMLDTVYRDQGIRDGGNYFAGMAPPSGIFTSSDCGPLPPLTPDTLQGIRTDILLRRPAF